jgi:hypothetical protein
MVLARGAGALFIVAACWMLMQAVHELGHVLGAWATGGTVVRVVLHPLEISRTDVSPNPAPLVVAWAGPIIGVLIPAAIAGVYTLALDHRSGQRIVGTSPTARSYGAGRSWLRAMAMFFAGFCLIANGAYIGVGSWEGVGDAGEMLRHGSPRWVLVAFGLVSVVGGLWVWHVLSTPRGGEPVPAVPVK